MDDEQFIAIDSARRERSPFVIAVKMTRMPIIFTDFYGASKTIVFANDAFLKLTGYTRPSIIGQHLGIVFDGGTEDIERLIAEVSDDHESDLCCRRNDGSTFWATVVISPVVNAIGVTTNFFASFVDQTLHIEERDRILALNADLIKKSGEVRALQASMIQASRLSAMGMVGATMAHEINQPLAAVTNYLRGARRRLEAAQLAIPAGVLDALARADDSAVRAGHIIRRIRDVAKRPLGLVAQESVISLVKEACELALADAVALGVDAVVDLGDEDSSVMVDRIEVQQALINLITNAMEAVAGQARRQVFVSIVVCVGDFCEVIVRDSGPGISTGSADKLFEPFNTTKADGVGIGLSISRTIIESHSGRLWLASTSDSGAEFRFSLPRYLESM